MKVEEGKDYTGITIIDENKIDPEMVLIIQKAGGGKSLCAEGMLEEYHDSGYGVVSLTDFKDELEICYAMFEPQERFHLNRLIHEGKQPRKKEMEIYHPFSFNIPKTLLPKMNIFTIPLKSLDRPKLSFIAESHYETDSVRLLNNAIQSLGINENIYDLVHYIQKHAKTQRTRMYGKDIVQPDEETFFLDTSQKGSITSVSEIASWFKPFLIDYLLTPANFKLNLDVKKILEKQKPYHCLINKWVKDEKVKYFSIMCFFDEIIKNIEYAKHPMVFLIEEVARLSPYHAEGYKFYLAEYLRDQLITMRSKGRGCASIMTSQIWWDIEEKIREKATQIFFGNLRGVADIDRISKSLKYKGDTTELLRTLKRNTYIMMGEEDMEGFRFFFPSHCHAEPKYNFIEMYRRFYPESMIKYSELIEEVKDHLKTIEKEYKQKALDTLKGKVKIAEEEYKEKIGVIQAEKEVEEMKEKYKGLKESSREEKIKKVEELRKDNPEFSIRKIAEILGISKSTVELYIKKIEQRKILPKIEEKNRTVDYKELSKVS